MEQRVRLTKTFVEKSALSPSSSNINDRSVYYDTEVRGLVLRVSSSGRKTFSVFKKLNGRPVRVTLGAFPDLSVEQARKRAQEIISDIALGINPNEEKEARRNELTFGELFERYLEKYAKPRKKSWEEEDQKRYQRDLSQWANKRLSSIKRSEIEYLHATMKKNNGPYAANRVLSLLHCVFNRAIEWQLLDKNPAAGIKKFPENPRKRFLDDNEMPAFLQALNAEKNEDLRDFVWLALFTGARKANILAMRWKDADLENAMWVIPDTKSGTSQAVPLLPKAVTLLTKRKKNNGSEFVFPSTGKGGHLIDPKKGFHSLLKRAGITQRTTIHDLRRTVGSQLAQSNANAFIIQRALGHKTLAATRVYTQLDTTSIRQSLEVATSKMLRAGTRKGRIDGTMTLRLQPNDRTRKKRKRVDNEAANEK